MSNRMIAVAAVSLLGFAAASSHAEPTLLEGFETISSVSSRGDVSAVKAGQGVTEGNVAARLAPKASISVRVEGALFGSAGWIKVDTLTSQILSQPLHIDVDVGRHRRDRDAWAKGGKDTIALPVSVVRHSIPVEQRLARVTIRITNTGDSPLILDNLRLEPPAEAPDGAVLLDFGRSDQVVWPGFTAADRASQYVVWSGNATVHEYTAPYPDPLGKDFVGRPPSTKVLDYFALTGPEGKAASVWIWATHYASRAETQPTEYVMKVRGRTVLQQRHSMRDMLTDEGLLLGKNGDWTPEWFDEKLAPRFVDCVQTQIRDGKNRVDVGNCQIAAIAMAPVSSKLAMAKYVKQVKEDISRYRRQFVLGARHDPICSVEPTAEETKQGAMVFAADPDRIYDGRWKPAAADRITKAEAIAPAGGLAVFELAFVPLRKGVLTGVRLRNFTKKDTSVQLGTMRGKTKAWVVNRVPRVRKAAVEFAPFVLERRSNPLKARETQIVLGMVQVATNAQEGLYEGEIQLSFGREQVTLPATIRVYPHGGKHKNSFTLGADRTIRVGHVYSTMSSVFSDPLQERLTKSLRNELFDMGFNSMVLGGVHPTRESGARASGLVDILKKTPMREMDGAPVVSLDYFFRRLGWWNVMPASARHRAYSKSAASEIKEVFAETPLSAPLLRVGSVRHNRGWDNSLIRAQQIAAAGGKPLLHVYAHSLKGGNVAKAEKAFAAWSVVPDRGGLDARFAAYKRRGQGRKIFLDYHRMDRYLSGFFATALETDGVFMGGVYVPGGMIYVGDRVDGRGLFVPQERGVGTFLPTINLVHLWRGMDDRRLLGRCEDLLQQATDARVGTVELEGAIGAVKDAVTTHGGLDYDTVQMRTSDVPPTKLRALRVGLVQAAAAVTNRMKGRAE